MRGEMAAMQPEVAGNRMILNALGFFGALDHRDGC